MRHSGFSLIETLIAAGLTMAFMLVLAQQTGIVSLEGRRSAHEEDFRTLEITLKQAMLHRCDDNLSGFSVNTGGINWANQAPVAVTKLGVAFSAIQSGGTNVFSAATGSAPSVGYFGTALQFYPRSIATQGDGTKTLFVDMVAKVERAVGSTASATKVRCSDLLAKTTEKTGFVCQERSITVPLALKIAASNAIQACAFTPITPAATPLPPPPSGYRCVTGYVSWDSKSDIHLSGCASTESTGCQNVGQLGAFKTDSSGNKWGLGCKETWTATYCRLVTRIGNVGDGFSVANDYSRDAYHTGNACKADNINLVNKMLTDVYVTCCQKFTVGGT